MFAWTRAAEDDEMGPHAAIAWGEVETSLLGRRDLRLLPPWAKLPAPSATVLEFTRKAQEPDADAEELGRIIERDATLTCLLLRRVNSAASGFGQKANSAQEAIVRLGIRHSLLFLLTEGMKQVTALSRSRVIDMPRFACENLERALFARHVAAALGADQELAFAGALLADCLLPVLTGAASQTYLRFLERQDAQSEPLVEFEEREFGWTHPLATALIFAGWGFPPELVCCVGIHHHGPAVLDDSRLKGTPAAAVAVAALIPDQLRQAPAGLDHLRTLEGRLPGFDLEQCARVVTEQCAELLTTVENRFPLARRCQPPQKKRRWFGRG